MAIFELIISSPLILAVLAALIYGRSNDIVLMFGAGQNLDVAPRDTVIPDQ